MQSIVITGKLDAQQLESVKVTLATDMVEITLAPTFSHWLWYAEQIHPYVDPQKHTLTIAVLPENVESVQRYRLDFPAFALARLSVRILNARWIVKLKDYDQIAVGTPSNLITFECLDGMREGADL